MTEASTLGNIGDGKYVLVTTYRRDNTAVPTPLWVVRDGDAIAVWTPTGSGKVKRIRHNPQVMVAPCTFGGEPLGDAVPARAEILDAAGSQRIRKLIKKKYWLTGPLTVNLSQLRRGAGGTVGIRFTSSDSGTPG
jgi:uncharacterized protein